MEVLTYVPSNVSLLFSGYEIKGWTQITASRNAPNYKQIRGIHSKHTRSRFLDRSAILKISTLQSEPVNDVLSLILSMDNRTGACRLEVMLKESTGTSLFSTTSGYILAFPEISYSGELATYTWEIACDDATFWVGKTKPALAGMLAGGVSALKGLVS